MKKALLIWATAVILVLTGSVAWATPFIPGSVTFSEGVPTEGVAFLSIAIPQPLGAGQLSITSFSTESGSVHGIVGTGLLVVPGTRAVLFTGIGDLPVSTNAGVVNLSDYAIVTVASDGKSFDLLFESNGSSTFTSNLSLIPATNTPGTYTSIIAETGDFQDIGGDLIAGTVILGLNVDELTSVSFRSDLDVVVPLPPSLLLMGSGLLGLVGLRRFYKG
jgi:hypothetical protein